MSDQCQVANRLPIELRHSFLAFRVTLKSPICTEGHNTGVQTVNNTDCEVWRLMGVWSHGGEHHWRPQPAAHLRPLYQLRTRKDVMAVWDAALRWADKKRAVHTPQVIHNFNPTEVWLAGGNFRVTLNTGCQAEQTIDGQPQMWITIRDSRFVVCLCRCVSAFRNPQMNSSNYSTTPDETLLLGNNNYKRLFKSAEMLNGLNK